MNEFSKKRKELEKERKCLLKKAQIELKTHGFKKCKFVGKGTFGDVIKCKDPDRKCNVAIKIVSAKVSSWGERTAWQYFDHCNIVPLLRMIQSEKFDAFLMPFYPKTLDDYLKDKRFHKKRSAYEISRTWLRDILNGMEYLHKRKLCHLDLKTNNILMTSERNAVISDFTFVDSSSQSVQRYGLPHFYRPPETCIGSANSSKSDGTVFDVWSFGIVALHICAGKWFRKQIVIYEQNWNDNVYPVLFYCLQPHMFAKLMKVTFPRSDVSSNQISEALNLVQATLRYYPEDRPSVSSILKHSMITKQVEITFFETDAIWNKCS